MLVDGTSHKTVTFNMESTEADIMTLFFGEGFELGMFSSFFEMEIFGLKVYLLLLLLAAVYLYTSRKSGKKNTILQLVASIYILISVFVLINSFTSGP